jgi:UDP-3-O-[3-hydroxymyristoyl] glucosamine N-acyltransferase
MKRREPVIEVIDGEMAALLREKTGAERLEIGDQMFVAAREMIEASVRQNQPQLSSDQVRQEVARRIAGDSQRIDGYRDARP